MTQPELQDGHYCFFVPIDSHVEGKGFRPSIVVESVPGHYPNGGGDVEPWYWGDDLEVAENIAAKRNCGLGLSQDDVDRIIASSMHP